MTSRAGGAGDPSSLNPAIRPMTASGRPVTGFLRPGTSSARPTTGSMSASDAFKGSRPGTTRPMTSLGRQLRLGTASMMTQLGGPFINVEALDLRKYATRPAIAKALCDYILYHDKNPRKAAELASAATVHVSYGDWWWKARLGKCYYQLGLLRDAERQLKSALSQHESVETILELCKVYLRLDQPNTAIEWYLKGIENFATDATLLVGLARVYDMLNDSAKSIKMYRDVLAVEASNVEAIASLASDNFYSDRPEVALKYYRRLLQMGVQSPELWNNLGLCCFYASQYDMTLTCFERALALADDATMSDVWFNVGIVAIGIGDLGLAYQAFKIAVSITPSHAESLVNLGVLELRKGSTDAARSNFQAAQRLASFLYEPFYNGALLAYKLGDFSDAFALVSKALEIFPGHTESKDLLKQLRTHFTLA